MNFRISPRKLRFLANQIAGKPINKAITQMEFSPKKASKKIMNSLITARDHAWRYKAMDSDKCYIGISILYIKNYLREIPIILGGH